MLNSILCVTFCAPDLFAVETAYTTYLKYRVAERGQLSAALAQHWQAPRLKGRNYLLLQPESGAEVYLRFIQAEPVAGYEPLKTFGWNATELLVQDPDALAERLVSSPFKVIGPPRNLSTGDAIRAMQVLGPANELLYLTRVAPGSTPFNLGTATSPVDKVFIVVCGAPELDAARRYYAEQVQLNVTEASDVRISVLSKAHDLNPETLHSLALGVLRETGLIELDQYPPQAVSKPPRPGDLPPGMAVVSFGVKALAAYADRAVSLPDSPYCHDRAVLLQGAASELIELVERPVS